MSKPKLISQVLDVSHANWVQGGVFKDIRLQSNMFERDPIYLPPVSSIRNLVLWFFRCIKISQKSIVLFSSITPLENYLKFPPLGRQQRIGLWYTHKDGDYSASEKRALKAADVIFVHSGNEIDKVRSASNGKIVQMLAAIDPIRFSRPASIGEKIVWAGTPSERKNPDLFLKIVDVLPDFRFRLIGHDWSKSKYSEQIFNKENLEYLEYQGPLKSETLDGCRIYLMTSRIEGGPMPLLESLAAGLIPVCTKTGFVVEIFKFLNLPPQLVIEPTMESILGALNWVKKEGLYITPEQRSRILTLDFQRLTRMLEQSLISV